MDTIVNIFKNIVDGAERLAGLSVAAVWAFFTIILIAYVIWDQKTKKQASEMAWQARIKDAETDGMMANAIEKLADQIKELRIKLKCLGGDDD